MSRPGMSSEQKEKIKELATQMDFTQASKIVGVSRRTVSRIVRGVHGKPRPRENRWNDLRKAEARVTPHGCFNVFDRSDWLSGFSPD